jgi:hypothetical protein
MSAASRVFGIFGFCVFISVSASLAPLRLFFRVAFDPFDNKYNLPSFLISISSLALSSSTTATSFSRSFLLS